MALARRLFVVGALALLASAGAIGVAFAEENGRGKELFELCSQCHGPEGGGNRQALAPAIAGLSEWYLARQLEKFRSGLRGLHPGDVGGLRMYPMSLTLKTDEELWAVAAYVASLPPSPPAPLLSGGDPEKGKELYAPCVACHAADASGNEQLGGPNLKVSGDWYLLTQLHNYRSGIRGASPQDQQGVLMRPMALSLADEQALRDVIAYIMTLVP